MLGAGLSPLSGQCLFVLTAGQCGQCRAHPATYGLFWLAASLCLTANTCWTTLFLLTQRLVPSREFYIFVTGVQSLLAAWHFWTRFFYFFQILCHFCHTASKLWTPFKKKKKRGGGQISQEKSKKKEAQSQLINVSPCASWRSVSEDQNQLHWIWTPALKRSHWAKKADCYNSGINTEQGQGCYRTDPEW